MTTPSHELIRESLRERIQAGEWALGERIPDELDLATEYGCARATMNRALQALAEGGLIVRKRKGGTRVNPNPARKATFEIPLLRQQIEATGAEYHHQLQARSLKRPPKSIHQHLRLSGRAHLLYLETLHLADERPFAFETRWVSTHAVPGITDAEFGDISVNEWLVKTVPFSAGDVSFSAVNADTRIAERLAVTPGEALFTVNRTTWLDAEFITNVQLYYHPGYTLTSEI